jgi:putative transposase
MIEPGNSEISIELQCNLLGLSRSGYYYEPVGESPMNLHLMDLIDAHYTRRPSWGVNKLTAWLNQQGYAVNPKRVRRLMRKMGLEAIYPKRHLSIGNTAHQIYPYLLRGVVIERPNQVWCADITYLRMRQGFLYLIAILDWFSRYVVAWELSNTLEGEFCLRCLERALSLSQSEIFNTDQGSQFTSYEFTGRLQQAGIRISMDGKGRVFDNIFIERLWRTVKYEEVYLHSYETPKEAHRNLENYFQFYNGERLHESLGYRTPQEIYFSKEKNSPLAKVFIKSSCNPPVATLPEGCMNHPNQEYFAPYIS